MNESSLPDYCKGTIPPQSQRQSRRSFLRTWGIGAAALALAACIAPPANLAPSALKRGQPAASNPIRQEVSARLQLPDTELFYQVVGEGLPCIVLHGGLGLDHTYFRPWLDPLGDRLQLIYVDLRGNGRSGRPPLESLTFDQLAADVDALRAALGAEKIALLGHSYGGFVALEYALRYPERVSHLLLIDTAPAFDYGAEIQVGVERKQPSAEVLAAVAAPPPPTDAEFAQLWQTVLPLYFYQYAAEMAQAAFAQTIYSTAAVARSQELLATYNVTDRLAEIQAPTLIVVGDDDIITPPSQAQRIQAGIPHARLAVIAQSGHFPFIEQPQAFEQAARGWLDQVR